MHKVERRGGPAATAASAPPATPEAIAKLRTAETVAALDDARKSVWALYAAASAEVPLEVEAAAHERLEALEQNEEVTL